MGKICNFTEQDIAKIKKLYEQGKGSTTIGPIIGCSWCTINKIIEKNGWKRLAEKTYVGQKFGRLTVLKELKPHARIRKYAECICECGKYVSVVLSKLLNGHTKSCGCLRKGMPHPWHRKGYGESSFNRLYDSYLRNAKRRDIAFELTKEEMKTLFKGNCYYCGDIPKTIMSYKNGYGQYVYNGIDRLDNTKPYSVENCVSCCKRCNFMKSGTHYKDFILWIRKAYNNTESVQI